MPDVGIPCSLMRSGKAYQLPLPLMNKNADLLPVAIPLQSYALIVPLYAVDQFTSFIIILEAALSAPRKHRFEGLNLEACRWASVLVSTT
jgi:hypothetical protein